MTLHQSQLSITFLVNRLRVQVHTLIEQQYPGDHRGPHKWLSLIVGMLDTAEELLIKIDSPGTSQQKISAYCRDAAHLAGLAYQYLILMRGATQEELPYSVVPPLQRWFDQLGVENTTFFRVELVANYELKEFTREILAGIRYRSDSLTKAINDIEWPILRVTVPGRAFAILPHFAVVAHEIGHALEDKIQWDLSGFADENKALKLRICKRLGQTQLDDDTNQYLLEVFGNWFNEVAADAFAFFLTGPAIFFSLSELSQFYGGDSGISATHPAHELRRDILFDQLNKGPGKTYAEVFQRHTGIPLTKDFNSFLMISTPEKDKLFSAISKRNGQKIAAVIAELHESIPKVAPIIYSHVQAYMNQHASGAIYSSNKYDEDLEMHMPGMLAAIPPIEAGMKLSEKTPVDFPSILNVGWVVLLTKLATLRVGGEDDLVGAQKLETLHGLLLKAVELSEIRRLWEGVG